MSWTDERVETLKRMWGEGQSASQIAKELGGVTRNAVIGKVHRLGLSNRTAAAPAKAEPEAKPAPAKAEPAQAEKPAADTPPPPSPARKAIIPAGQPLPPQPSANEIPAESLAKAEAVEKKAKKISLMELTERTCKWPIGDPATDDFYFCGLPAQQGKPYCEAHVGVAFQPMSSRRDRKR
ncbi:MAG: GcrA cell cycle regulator [Rhodobacterales bacterium]|nr:MAG: GcrA cell cycle regulator [Rhodobacterales bacterium]